jgi:hypothetical protein
MEIPERNSMAAMSGQRRHQMEDERRIGRHGDTIPASPMSKEKFEKLPRLGDVNRDDQAAKLDQASRQFENRFPAYMQRERENAKRVAAVARGHEIDAFFRRYGRMPTAAELGGESDKK